MKKVFEFLFAWGIGIFPSFAIYFITGILLVSLMGLFGVADGQGYDIGFWTSVVTVAWTIIGLVYLNIRKK